MRSNEIMRKLKHPLFNLQIFVLLTSLLLFTPSGHTEITPLGLRIVLEPEISEMNILSSNFLCSLQATSYALIYGCR